MTSQTLFYAGISVKLCKYNMTRIADDGNLPELPESVVLIDLHNGYPPPRKGFTFSRFDGDKEAKSTRNKIPLLHGWPLGDELSRRTFECQITHPYPEERAHWLVLGKFRIIYPAWTVLHTRYQVLVYVGGWEGFHLGRAFPLCNSTRSGRICTYVPLPL